MFSSVQGMHLGIKILSKTESEIADVFEWNFNGFGDHFGRHLGAQIHEKSMPKSDEILDATLG